MFKFYVYAFFMQLLIYDGARSKAVLMQIKQQWRKADKI
jgi:hypothetical protein